MLGPDSVSMHCPECRAHMTTDIKTKAGTVPIVSSVLLCLFGCVLGCCLVPCFLKECLDVEHYCSTCKTYLGRFKRFD